MSEFISEKPKTVYRFCEFGGAVRDANPMTLMDPTYDQYRECESPDAVTSVSWSVVVVSGFSVTRRKRCIDINTGNCPHYEAKV